MSRKITISDIAKKLNVSESLVSFVLNGKAKEMRISEKMQKKVLETAKELHYKPSFLAKSFRTGKSNTIGLIVADISNSFFSKLAGFIEKETEKSNYNLIFMSSDENKNKFKQQVMTFIERNIDGLIIVPPVGSEQTLNMLSRAGVPFVILDRILKSLDVTSIVINNYEASFLATKKLLKNSRERIAFINVNEELETMHQRTLGYQDALKEHGINVDPKIIKHLEFSHSKRSVQKAMKEVVNEKIDAILFTTNKLGIFGIESLHEMGKKIPEDISIISFDDSEAFKITSPSITAIKQPLMEMAKKAVEVLFKKMESEGTENQIFAFNAELIIRNSCK